MFYIGIDIASQKHDCCILSPIGKELASFTFLNNAEGFRLLLSKIPSLPEETKIGLEATGIYGLNLHSFLRRKGFDIITINPLIIKNRRSGTTLRKTKTDKSDARFLAETLMREDFQPDQDIVYHIQKLKSLSRSRFHFVQNRSSLKNQVRAILTITFPEFSTFFSDIFGTSALSLLKLYPTAKCFSEADPEELAELLRKSSRGRFGREKVQALCSAAASSVGTHSAAKALELPMLLEQIDLLDKQIKRFEMEIEVILTQTDTVLLTIPGIGPVLGSLILGEIGDIHRFANAGKLLAFAGLEPSVYQSGKFTPASGSMVKRGSPYLRWALIQAAKYAAKFDPTFAAYLTKKRNEGKHYNVAISHLAKKLVRVIFSILKNNSPYSVNYTPLST